MDENGEAKKIDLSALRQKFENDPHPRCVNKRLTAFEISKSQFDGPGKDVVLRKHPNDSGPSASQRRSSEADLIKKPVIAQKPQLPVKKASAPNIFAENSSPHCNGQGDVSDASPQKGKSVVQKHAALFEQHSTGAVPTNSDKILPNNNKDVKEVKKLPISLPTSNVSEVKTKPPKLPKQSITSPELKRVSDSNDWPQNSTPELKLVSEILDFDVRSRKKLFEQTPDTKSSSVKPKLSEDGQTSQGLVLSSKAKTAEKTKNIDAKPSVPSESKPPSFPPPKPPRSFAHDVYKQVKLQRPPSAAIENPLAEDEDEEHYVDDIFGTVEFRSRGVILGEDEVRQRLDTNTSVSSYISVPSSDSSFHDYEDVTPTSPPNFPQSPAGKLPFSPPKSKNFLSPEDDAYSALQTTRIRSWETPTISLRSNKSQLSQRSNSDECLYSRTYEGPTSPLEYMDPVKLFATKPKPGVPGFPDVEIDDYGYAVPQYMYNKLRPKTPICLSRSLDGHTRYQPQLVKSPEQIAKDTKKDVKKTKPLIIGKPKKKAQATSPQKSDDCESSHFYIKKEDPKREGPDYLKAYRRKPVVRQKIGQAFSVLRRHAKDGDYEFVEGKEDDRKSNDSESQIDIKELQRRIRYVTTVKERNQSIYERERAFREKIYPQLFEYAVLVGLEMVNGSCEPVVLHKFPHHVDPERTSIPEFCFPDKDVLMPVTKYDSENFSFVLTSVDGRRDYGYCKRMLPPGRGARLPEVICIISPLGAHTLYTQVLDQAEKRRQVSCDYVMELIAAIYAKPLPSLGRSISVNSMNTQGMLETLTLSRQEDTRMENVNFEYLFSCLGTENVLQVFSAILLERRTLFSASKLSTLSNCIHALVGLLYPFQWQHTYIPVLPAALLDITCAPTPYIIGIMSPYLPKIDDLPTEEVLIIDLDKAMLLRTCDDEMTIIPRKLQKALIGALTMGMEDSDGQKNVLISEAFVRLFVESIGHYEEHIATQQDGQKVFQKESFCKATSSKSLRMFLEWFCETQMFHMFINDHLEEEEREKGLFDARIAEYKQELASLPPTTWNNFREMMKNIGKAIKTNIKGSGDQKKKAT